LLRRLCLFRALHSGLTIPDTAGSDPLLAMWNALHYSPSLEEVFADLHPFLHQVPPLEKFADLIQAKQGNSSGGPTGLQYKFIQHRQPQMIAEAYECLLSNCGKTVVFQQPGNRNGLFLSPKMPLNAFRTYALSRSWKFFGNFRQDFLLTKWLPPYCDNRRSPFLNIGTFLITGLMQSIYNFSTRLILLGRDACHFTVAYGI